MSIPHLIRQIRALSYNDMMMVANELRDRIDELTHHKIEAVVLADILVRLQAGTVKPDAARCHADPIYCTPECKSPPPTDALTLEQLTAAIAYMGCDTDREYTPEAFARDLFAAARQSSTKTAAPSNEETK